MHIKFFNCLIFAISNITFTLYLKVVRNKEALSANVVNITSNSSGLVSSTLTLMGTIIEDLTDAAIEQTEVPNITIYMSDYFALLLLLVVVVVVVLVLLILAIIINFLSLFLLLFLLLLLYYCFLYCYHLYY